MERIVRSWLEPGLTTLTDDVLDPVLDQLPATPQRRRWSPARRIVYMNPIAKYGIAAAAVVVIAIVGFNLLSPAAPSQVGGVASPSAAPASNPVPLAPTGRAIEAGRYRLTSPGAEVTFAVQDGWIAREGGLVKHDETPAVATLDYGLDDPPGHGNALTHVYADACHGEGALERIGDTAADLVAALDAQKGTDAVIRDVTAGGVVGQRVEIRESPGVDRSTCRYHNPESPLQISADPGENDYIAFGPGFWGVFYVFDVDGERLLFRSGFGPEATEADAEAIDAIVESFEFSTP
jgi:hypothetical protein